MDRHEFLNLLKLLGLNTLTGGIESALPLGGILTSAFLQKLDIEYIYTILGPLVLQTTACTTGIEPNIPPELPIGPEHSLLSKRLTIANSPVDTKLIEYINITSLPKGVDIPELQIVEQLSDIEVPKHGWQIWRNINIVGDDTNYGILYNSTTKEFMKVGTQPWHPINLETTQNYLKTVWGEAGVDAKTISKLRMIQITSGGKTLTGLVMPEIEGQTLLNLSYQAFRSPNTDLKTIVANHYKQAWKISAQMLEKYGLYLKDPNLGNFIVTPKGAVIPIDMEATSMQAPKEQIKLINALYNKFNRFANLGRFGFFSNVDEALESAGIQQSLDEVSGGWRLKSFSLSSAVVKIETGTTPISITNSSDDLGNTHVVINSSENAAGQLTLTQILQKYGQFALTFYVITEIMADSLLPNRDTDLIGTIKNDAGEIFVDFKLNNSFEVIGPYLAKRKATRLGNLLKTEPIKRPILEAGALDAKRLWDEEIRLVNGPDLVSKGLLSKDELSDLDFRFLASDTPTREWHIHLYAIQKLHLNQALNSMAENLCSPEPLVLQYPESAPTPGNGNYTDIYFEAVKDDTAENGWKYVIYRAILSKETGIAIPEIIYSIQKVGKSWKVGLVSSNVTVNPIPRQIDVENWQIGKEMPIDISEDGKLKISRPAN